MGNSQFDLVVVGAGVLGTFHAYHAAKLGMKVLHTEKDQYPVNATVRNFGQVVPSGMNSQWFGFGTRSTEIYKEIQQDFDISIRNNGSVYIASDKEEQQLLHELKSIMDNRGYPSELLSATDCFKKWPSLRTGYCKEAISFPTEVSVEPERMIYRVLEFAQTRFSNLTYRPSTAIIDCAPFETGIKVIAATGEEFIAEKAIICNGGDYKLLFPDLFRASGIVISKLQMMRTVPMPQVKLDGNILTGLTIRRYESFEECPSFSSLTVPDHLEELTQYGIHILFKKAIDDSIIIGDSHEYAEVQNSDNLGFTINHHIHDLMLAEASRIVNFNVRHLSSSWAGFYPQHPEKDIVEIDIENRIHIRTAIGGKGMTSGPGYAETSIRNLFNLNEKGRI